MGNLYIILKCFARDSTFNFFILFLLFLFFLLQILFFLPCLMINLQNTVYWISNKPILFIYQSHFFCSISINVLLFHLKMMFYSLFWCVNFSGLTILFNRLDKHFHSSNKRSVLFLRRTQFKIESTIYLLSYLYTNISIDINNEWANTNKIVLMYMKNT